MKKICLIKSEESMLGWIDFEDVLVDTTNDRWKRLTLIGGRRSDYIYAHSINEYKLISAKIWTFEDFMEYWCRHFPLEYKKSFYGMALSTGGANYVIRQVLYDSIKEGCLDLPDSIGALQWLQKCLKFMDEVKELYLGDSFLFEEYS